MIKEIANTERSRRGSRKILSMGERNGVRCVRRLLSGELATALDIHLEEMPDYVRDQTGCSTGTI